MNTHCVLQCHNDGVVEVLRSLNHNDILPKGGYHTVPDGAGLYGPMSVQGVHA